MLLFIIFIHLFVAVYSIGPDQPLICRPQVLDNKDEIYLIKRQTALHSDIEQLALQQLNNKFIEVCEHFYNIQVSKFDNSWNKTIEAIHNETNVINLWASDYYNYSSTEINSQLVYAGDIVYQTYQVTENEYEEYSEIVTEKIIEKRLAKVVSSSVASINSGELLDFIETLQYNESGVTSRLSCLKQATKTTDLNIVLICADQYKDCFRTHKPISYTLNFIFKKTHECGNFIEIYQNNLLAVIAPTPFEMDYEAIVPTIFYETLYMDSEDDGQFPNSINLISGLLLKYAFMNFINDAEWRRIAIISDDTPYSRDFERELLEMFHEKQLIYNVQRCDDVCNFEKAVRYLMSVDARIIIANVNEDNSRKLTDIIRRYNSKFTILFRVPPFWDYKIQNWISIQLGPTEKVKKICKAPKTSLCLGIMQALGIVTKVHANLSHSEVLHRASFFRKFATSAKKEILPGVTAYVKRMHEDISKMHIENNGKITNFVSIRKPFDGQILDQRKCIAKINKFERPCDHSVYLYLMFVIIMFAITLLTITCYFHESSPLISESYQQL